MKKCMSFSLFLFLFAFVTGCTNQEALTPSQENVNSAARKGTTSPLVNPITGTADGKSFSGVFTITSFTQDGTQILAVGTLTNVRGKLSGAAKTALEGQQLTLPVSFPAMQQAAAAGDITAQATCQVLDLTLGPLDLNLLGLVVHLDQVNLTIDAQSGGGILGDLLCAVANLLNPTSFLANLGAIATLLNQIVGILQGL